MDANDNQYGSLTPNPEDEPEEKKDNKKKALIGLAALLALGGASAVCIGTGFINNFLPEEEVIVKVTPTKKTQQPQATPTEQEPVEIDEGWLGSYEGIARGFRTSEYQGEIYTSHFADHDNALWLEIFNQDDCYGSGFCNEDRSWGVDISLVGCYNGKDITDIRIFLPDDLNEAEGLTLTDSILTIEPSDGHPYALTIYREAGQVEGWLETDGIPSQKGESLNWYVVDTLEADRSAEDHPCMR